MAEQQCPLIAVPIKLTEQVDLATPVRAIISTGYGDESAAQHADHLAILNRARQDAVKEGGAGNIATQRDLLLKWFHCLEVLELRFPELRIPFPWKDAFSKKHISQYSIAYEKASVIFNIAATLSSLGASQGRHAGNPDGIKKAYTAFRQAAGMFNYINENFLHAPSTDMSRDVIKCLVDLMLAQASEVFLEKSVEERKGNGLVAKIASHVAAMYSALSEDMKEWVNKGVFDRLWLMMLQVKAKYFASVTQYYRALADDAKGDHGVCLVRLTLAESFAREASRLMAPFNSSLLAAPVPPSTLPSDAGTALTALVSTHLALCSGRKDVAIKDNDLIYHDILPSESALETVDKFVAATPISIQDIYATPEVQKAIGQVDLFSELVPLGVHESASMYSEEKAKLARAESERHDISNGELQAALDYMGLPAALNVYRNNDAAVADLTDPGSEVLKWAEEEAHGGGARGADGLGDTPDAIETALHQIDLHRHKAGQELDACARLIDEETRECEQNRLKYEHRWTQSPSAVENKELRQELKVQREALVAAKVNDERIEGLWNQIKADVKLLGRGRDALEQAFAEAVSAASSTGRGAASANKPEASLLDLDDNAEDEKRANAAQEEERMQTQIKQLEALLAKLPKIKKERADVLADLKERIQTDDISHLLILNRRNTPSNGQESSLFQAELEKFKPHQQRIALSIKQQTAVLAEVTELWKQLTESGPGREARTLYEARKSARKALVERLRKARDGYAEVRAAVHRGLQFYDELESIATQLRRDTDSFVTSRRATAQKLANELSWDAKLGEPEHHPGSLAPTPGASSYAVSAAQTVAARPEPAPMPSAATSYFATVTEAPSTRVASPLNSAHGLQPPHSSMPPAGVPPTSAFAQQYSSVMTSPPHHSAPAGAATSPYGAPPPHATGSGSHYTSPPPPPPPCSTSPYNSYGGHTSAYSAASSAGQQPYSSPHSLSLAGLSLGGPTSPSPAPAPSSSGSSGVPPPPPPQPFVAHYNPGAPPSAAQHSYAATGGHGSAPSYGMPPPPPQPASQYQQPQYQQHQQGGYASQGAPSPYGAPPPPPPSAPHASSYQQGGYQHPPPPPASLPPSGPQYGGGYAHPSPQPAGQQQHHASYPSQLGQQGYSQQGYGQSLGSGSGPPPPPPPHHQQQQQQPAASSQGGGGAAWPAWSR